MRRFGKARIFVDGVELLVKRYSFLQQVRHSCLRTSGQHPYALPEKHALACTAPCLSTSEVPKNHL